MLSTRITGEVDHVKAQLQGHNGGFVRDFADSFLRTATARQFIAGYYPLDFLPALYALGRILRSV